MKVELRETILWHNRCIFLKEHLDRLAQSCRHLNFVFPHEEILKRLSDIEAELDPGIRYKLVLNVAKNGDFRLTHIRLAERRYEEKYVTISKKKVKSSDRFLYYKTTNKTMYIREFAKYTAKGFYDVLFTNEKGEITEGTYNNLIIRSKGMFYTPPVASGLVAGVYRAYCLRRLPIQEKTLYRKDLVKADRVFLCNSLTGMVRVTYVDTSAIKKSVALTSKKAFSFLRTLS